MCPFRNVQYTNVLRMCCNLHCIIGSTVTETNCGTQALIVATNDGVCLIPDHLQYFSLLPPLPPTNQIRIKKYDTYDLTSNVATFIPSIHKATYHLFLDIIKTNNQAGHHEIQGVENHHPACLCNMLHARMNVMQTYLLSNQSNLYLRRSVYCDNDMS